MPAVIGAPSQQRTNGSATNTFAHTVPATGARRAIRVFVGAFHASAESITGVTYGGVALTKVGATFGSISVNGIAEQYILVNPPTGTNNVVITGSAALDEIMGVASGWEDVNQATPTSGATGGSNAASANPSVSIPVSGSDVNVCGLEYYTGGTDTAVENGTNLAETGATAAASGWSDQYGTTSPRSWTLVSSAWAAAGCVLVHDGGGGPVGLPFRSTVGWAPRR